MSGEDGLVMQFHVGIVRGHNRLVRERFGNDKGGDIPTTCEFTQNGVRCWMPFGRPGLR